MVQHEYNNDASKKQELYKVVHKELSEKFLNGETELPLEQCILDQVPKIGYRHLQILLYFFLCFIGFGNRVVLSVGIVAMTDPKINNNTEIPTYPEWTDKNVVVSAFFWGYLIPQIFAGWAAAKFGAKWILICTFIVNSIAGSFIPQVASIFGSKGVMLSRVIQGFSQGFIYPSITHLLSQWVPSEERSLLGTFVYAASSCGTVFAMFITGFIAASSYGWPYAFYLYGFLSIIWSVLMIFLGFDTPALHPHISKIEKLYIQTSLGHTEEKINRSTPWKEILTSKPVWAVFLTQIGYNYCFWTLLTQIPSYLNYVMSFNIKKNSTLSSLPYILMWISSFGVGISSDFIINKKILSRTMSRKLFNSLGLFLPAIILIILGYTRSDQPIQGVILLILAVGTSSFHYSGWCVNHIDLSPNYAGTVMGLCNGFSQLSPIFAPLMVQFVVTNPTDVLQWRFIFFITAGIVIIAATIFVVFGSAKVQPWNDLKENNEEDETNTNNI